MKHTNKSSDPAAKEVGVQRLVSLLREHPGLTCTEIGEHLWPTRKNNRQTMARPAGKLVSLAKKAGLVKERLDIGKKHMRRTIHLANT